MLRRLLAISLLALLGLIPAGCGSDEETTTSASSTTSSTTNPATNEENEPRVYFGFLKMIDADGQGGEVRLVEESSPVALAGLRRGDVIVAIGGHPTADGVAVAETFEHVSYDGVPGSQLEVDIERGGKEETVKILLAPNVRIGAEVKESPKGKPPSLTVASVVADSPAEKAGVKPRDLIVAVGSRPVHTTADLFAGLGEHVAGDEVELTIERGGKEEVLTMTVEDRTRPPKEPPPE